MRQLKLFPSGCQTAHTKVMDAGSRQFAYCATMAIYVFDIQRLTLEKLLASPNLSTSSIAWSPVDDNCLASCSVHGTLSIWDIKQESVVLTKSFTGTVAPVQLEWSEADPTKLAVLSASGEVFVWSVTNPVNELSLLFTPEAQVVRWCRKSVPNMLAMGTRSGSIVIQKIGEKRVSRISCPFEATQVAAVIDLKWDPSSPTYLLAGYSNGGIFLIDVESQTIAMKFEQQTSLTALAWNRFVPGEFMSVTRNKSVMDHWNVSQPGPKSRSRLSDKKNGALTLHCSRQSPHLLISFVDGSVGLYNLKCQRMQFCSQPGHSETIFDCKFKPHDPNILATASFDGSIKLWDTQSAKCLLDMSTKCGCIYAVAWDPNPQKNHRLVSCCAQGTIHMWDTNSGSVLAMFKHHLEACYRVAWNELIPELIVSTSSDGSTVVFDPEGSIQLKISHSQPVYGCDFSRFEPFMLVTGSYDGKVRVYDTHRITSEPLMELQGHTHRVFNTIWSPLLRNTIASGSDDKTIRIWDTIRRTSFTLDGHHDRVRALIWNTEIPFVIVSGSWDSTIRVWDIRTRVCTSIVQDHQSDIYGLAAHPNRPFSIASSSRDTSLRLWEFNCDVVARIRIRCFVDLKSGVTNCCSTVEEAMTLECKSCLCGSASKKLATILESPSNQLPVNQATQLVSFFCSSPGAGNLMQLIESVVTGLAPTNDFPIVHVNHIAGKLSEAALSVRNLPQQGIGRGKRRDQLLQAAELLIRSGKYREYCEIMVEVHDWHSALAIAPAVGLPFWRKLCGLYADQMASTESVKYWMAAGKPEAAVEYFQNIGDSENAFLAAVSANNGATTDLSELTSIDSRTSESPIGFAIESFSRESKLSREPEAGTALVRSVSEANAREAFARGDAVDSACFHLAISNIHMAIHKLIRGGEFDLAYLAARALQFPWMKQPARFLALCAERLEMWDVASLVLDESSNPANERARVCARYQGQIQIEVFSKMMGVRSPQAYLSAISTGDDPITKLRNLVLGREFLQAYAFGIDHLRYLMSLPHWGLESAFGFIEQLHDLPTKILSPLQLAELLCYCSYLGAIVAKRKGFGRIVPKLFENSRKLIELHQLQFPVNIWTIATQQLRAMTAESNRTKALALGKLILQNISDNEPMRIAVKAMMSQLENDSSLETDSALSNNVLVTSSRLPSARHCKFPRISMFSGEPIQGILFPLPEGDLCIDKNDAIMWAMVNPFSPINSGHRLNPF